MSIKTNIAYIVLNLRFLKITKVSNLFKSLFYHVFRKTKTIKFWPIRVSIEATNLCNYCCPECPTGNNTLNRTSGNIDLALYKNIIHQIHKTCLQVQLHFQGEPLLHSELPEMISYAHQYKLITALSTNGSLLSEEYCMKIIEAGLTKINISLDGTSQKSYELYRNGGQFSTVIQGIKNLTRLKIIHKKNFPLVNVQFLVFKHNENEIKDFITLVKKTGANSYTLKPAQLYDYQSKPEQIPEK
ncbi:MAG: hypothetical protein C0594_10780, partial [Marinilabiliales bacterium]